LTTSNRPLCSEYVESSLTIAEDRLESPKFPSPQHRRHQVSRLVVQSSGFLSQSGSLLHQPRRLLRREHVCVHYRSRSRRAIKRDPRYAWGLEYIVIRHVRWGRVAVLRVFRNCRHSSGLQLRPLDSTVIWPVVGGGRRRWDYVWLRPLLSTIASVVAGLMA